MMTTTTPASFFAEAWAAFDGAAGSIWAASHRVGGQLVRLEGKGEAVARALLPALAHLRAETVAAGVEAPALTVRVWDLAAGGRGLPPLPLGPGDKIEHDRVVRLCNEHHVVVWERHFEAVTLVDRAAGRALYFPRDAAALAYYETAAPLRALWHAWFAPQGRLPLHGACVGRDGDVLLLTAPGGNGKSTTALLALQAGLDYLADDWCLLAPREPAAYSLFNTAKLRPDNLHRFPGLAGRIHNHDKLDEEKATFFLREDFGQQLRAGGRLRAIVVPRVSGEADTRVERANSALAWHALMEVTLRGVAGSGRELFGLLGEVARCAPVYRLHLGHDLAQIPPALEKILADERARTA
jgi:hypothetical protein